MPRAINDPKFSAPTRLPLHAEQIQLARHSPTSVAHVTSHLTISRRRQLRVDRVMRITCEANSG